MDAEHAGLMQMQLRHNAEDLQTYLKDLQDWEDEIKEKDRNLSKQKPILKEELPPIRSKVEASTSAGETKGKKRKKLSSQAKKKAPSGTRIKSFDYKSWDKFDVDKACEDVDYGVQSSPSDDSESSSEQEEDERKRQQAILEKEKGNVQYKKGEYELADESYSLAMELDPLSAVMPANRAMARLKLQRFTEAEEDCSLALALDSSYVKAYYRRASARVKLGKLQEAKLDYEAMLQLEPGNKQARIDLDNLEKSLRELAERKGFVFPVKRLPHLRSKKPLKRIHIEDIGSVEELPTTVTMDTPVVGESEKLKCTATTSEQLDSTPVKTAETTNSAKITERNYSFENPSASTTQVSEKMEQTSTTTTKPCQPSVSDSKRSGLSQTVESSDTTLITSHSAQPVSDGTKMEVLQQTCQEEHMESPSELARKEHINLTIPVAPDTSLQFQADWKRLKRDKSALATYFKSIPTSKYSVVLQQSLETEVFSEIISILYSDYVSSGMSCVKELTALTKVKRFSVAVMFLSRKDKESLVQLFRGLMDIATDYADKPTIISLSKEYSIDII